MLTKEHSKLPALRPSFIEPYARAVSELPEGNLWSYEAKLDGYRCLAAKHSGGVALWSRRGNGFTTRFPDVARACTKLPPNTLIDGEVVAVEEKRRAYFTALQQSRTNVHIQGLAHEDVTNSFQSLRARHCS